MLKTKKDHQSWLVTQPDHSQLAGTLAAHWGNAEFRQLGDYTPVANPSQLRSQAIFAIAQHDNGWIEWEAEPKLSASDSLPNDLSEMVRDQEDGMNRWRIGLRRFPNADFANLLISEHPRLLYKYGQRNGMEEAEIHPLFWKKRPQQLLPGSATRLAGFIDELERLQSRWKDRLAANPETRDWIEPETLSPHVRMLQILDGLSLGLTSSLIPARSGEARGLGHDTFELREVPQTSWEDRVTIEVRPDGENRVVLDPYPFRPDPLVVRVPVRVFDAEPDRNESFQTRWNTTAPQLLEFQLSSPTIA
tara:strand:- start:90 stop:1004 length:915 start_codon:yes stop_codon:yes gene_type:complete